jgi:prepilin-type N-terminal cleavage/methylation domain-containing protein
MPTVPQSTCSLYRSPSRGLPLTRALRQRGVTLIESMMALLIFGAVMLTVLGSFLRSREGSEAAVLHAAATSLVYGIIEQLRQVPYDQMPNLSTDPFEIDANGTSIPNTTPAPMVRVRINQDLVKWMRVRHKIWPANTPPTSWWGPRVTPAPSAVRASVGGPVADNGEALDNLILDLPLSQISGTNSQALDLNFWIWVEEIPDDYTPRVKRITIVYTYEYMHGGTKRTVRDREVFLLTKNAETI